MSTLKVLALVPKGVTLQGDIPPWLWLGWINSESGGNVGSTGLASLDERGLFQLTKEDSDRLGFNHDEVGTDSDISLQAGFAYINEQANILRKYPISGDDPDFLWWMVKFRHAIGSGATDSLLQGYEQQNGHPPTDLKSFKAYGIGIKTVFGHSFQKWSDATDKVKLEGKALALAAKLENPQVAIPLGLIVIAAVFLFSLGRKKSQASSQ